MRKKIRIGSRGSRLALRQAQLVRERLKTLFPHLNVRIVAIQTRGDRRRHLAPPDNTQTGIFTKEIETHLLSGKIDLAVHSLKDVPTSLPRGCCLAAYLKREDPRDALVTRGRSSLRELAWRARIGTSSPRRQKQLHLLRPDLRVLPLRGNLNTRIRHVLTKRLEAIVVAKAGLKRLGQWEKYSRSFKSEEMLPCIGQGILAIETRANNFALRKIVRELNDPRTEREGKAERFLLKTLRGGCRAPIGALARHQGNRLRLDAVICSTKSRLTIRANAKGSPHQPEALGKFLAKRLLLKGARHLIDEARER